MKNERSTDRQASGLRSEGRREMLKATTAAMIAAPLLGTENTLAAMVQSKAPLFFTREEFAMVDELTEIIIPADEHSPGARAAKVAEYIDFRLSESFTEEPQQMWRDGLKLIDIISREMNSKTLMQASPEERVALVTRIAKNEMKPQMPEEKFFVELKHHTARAYYSSKIGIHTEMEYKGNTYLKEFVGEEVKPRN